MVRITNHGTIIDDEYLSEVINSSPNHTDAETSYLEVYSHKFKSVTAGQCKIDSKIDSKIGNIIQEALDDIHRALAQKRIVSVKFAWWYIPQLST